MDVTIGLALIAGLVSFLSPCVLPLVPAYIGYMSGRVTQTVAAQSSKVDTMSGGGGVAVLTRSSAVIRFNTFLHGVAFVAGFTLIFVLFGLLITALTGIISVTVLSGVIGRIGGVVIIFFGLHFMGVLPSLFKRLRQQQSPLLFTLIVVGMAGLGAAVMLWGFTGRLDVWAETLWEREEWAPILGISFAALLLLWLFLSEAFAHPRTFVLNLVNRLDTLFYADTRPELNSANNGLLGSVLMGMVFSAGWTPCIGPVYGTILTVAMQTGDVSYALPLLTVYSLGLGIPFLVCALLLDGAQAGLRRLMRHMRTIKLVSGAFLVLIGVLVATGGLQDFSRSMTAQFSDLSVRAEECVLGWAQGEVYFNQLGGCLNGEVDAQTLKAQNQG
jgi:cytochrome c-type biogenesis protein